ncbi:MAG: energy transducer TonB [Pseudomonadota bacterium]
MSEPRSEPETGSTADKPVEDADSGDGSRQKSSPATESARRAASEPRRADPAIEMRYARAVRAAILRCKDYPRVARRMEFEGVVRVSFVLDRDGKLVESRLETSSGKTVLDRAAKDALACMQAPSFDPDMPGQTRHYELPLDFSLR